MVRGIRKGLVGLGAALLSLAFAQPAAANTHRISVHTNLSCASGGGAYVKYAVTNTGDETVYIRGFQLDLHRLVTQPPDSLPGNDIDIASEGILRLPVGHLGASVTEVHFMLFWQPLAPGETRSTEVPMGVPAPDETHPGTDLSGDELELHVDTWVADSALDDPDAVGADSVTEKHTFRFPGCNG